MTARVLGMALVAAATAAGATDVSDLRVMGVRSNCFEYTFMSSMSGAKGDRLVFNHVDGSTQIVQVGDRLGSYTVAAYTGSVERVHNPTLNADQERKSGTVVLRDAAGRDRVLKMGEVLPDEGWTACLVALDSGAWRYVVPGDDLELSDGTVRVGQVGPDGVRVRDATSERVVVALTDAERKAMADRWERDEQSRRLLAATPPPSGEQEVLPVYVPPEPLPPPPKRRGITFGTDFSYPVEFEVIPIQTVTPDGKVIMTPVALPTRFQRRTAGIHAGR